MEHGTLSTYSNHGCRCEECREANRLYHAEWYTRRGRARKRQRAQEKAYLIRDFKCQPCAHCGKTYPADAMDLHHPNRDPLLSNGSRRKWNSMTLVQLRAELEKCVVLCAICHRLLESSHQRQIAAANAE